jgi:hypothetical protein
MKAYIGRFGRCRNGEIEAERNRGSGLVYPASDLQFAEANLTFRFSLNVA